MHSGFEIPGLHQQHHHHQQPENSGAPLLLSLNPTHILDHIHALPTSTTQHLAALDHHNLLPPHHHHYPSSSAYYPLNFKLGGDALLRGSHQYQLPDARQSSLGMLHAPFWEPLEAEVSNENSEIVKHKGTLTNSCLDAKSRLHFSELDAIYKRVADTTQTQTQTLPEPSNPAKKKNKSSKKKKTRSPMTDFFEDLVKQVMEHQDNLQKKFTEVMDRLSEERRAREEAWRNQELAHFERQAAARAHEKSMAKSREAMFVSYLEKITGHKINLPPLTTSEITSDDSNCGDDAAPHTYY